MSENINIDKPKVKKRIDYIDTLKFLAIFAVIFLHAYKVNPHIMIMHHNFYKLRAFTDFGIPVFLMVTGALALNKDIDLEIFIKKKFTRIILPLVFYFLISYAMGIDKDFLVSFWYSWMIIGAYLAIPLVNKIIKYSSMKEIEYFVAMIVITSIFYCCSHFFDFKYALDLNFFITPLSYIVIGYFLFKKDFTKYLSPNKLILVLSVIFVIISIIKMKVGLLNCIYPSAHLFVGIDMGIVALIQGCCVFLIVKYVYDEHRDKFTLVKNFLQNKIIKKFIFSISRSTYGIFFVHVLVFRGLLYPIVRGMGFKGVTLFLIVIASGIIGLLLSWIITYILGHIPYIKYLSGYY